MSIAQWNSFTNYVLGNQVQNGSSLIYGCILDNTNEPPPNVTYWNDLSPVPTGVSSLSSLTGAITQSCNIGVYTDVGQDNVLTITIPAPYLATYYKTTAQNLTSGNTDVSFDGVGSWNNDGGYITHLNGTTDFTVVQTGLYQLEFSATILVNNGVWATTTNRNIGIDITRSPTAEQAVIQNSALQGVQNYQQSVTGTYYLLAGDVINCRVGNSWSAGTPTPPQANCIQNSFDLNTFFTWTYVSS